MLGQGFLANAPKNDLELTIAWFKSIIKVLKTHFVLFSQQVDPISLKNIMSDFGRFEIIRVYLIHISIIFYYEKSYNLLIKILTDLELFCWFHFTGDPIDSILLEYNKNSFMI